MRVLITGSAGFVGSHFHRRMLADGHQVTEWDVTDGGIARDCRRLFATDEGAWDLVIHCAAIVGGRAKIDGNPLAIAENLAIDSDLARWAVRARPGRILYFSSSAAYAAAYQDMDYKIALREDAIGTTSETAHGAWVPDQVYGWAKLTGERLMAEVEADGIPVHIVRPFSGYGETQSLDYPFGAFLDRAKHGADPFHIWGDGTAVRDWVHVDDVVEACLAIIAADYRQPVNIGTGRGVDFITLAAMFMDAAGYQGEIGLLPSKPTGVQYRVADPTLLHTMYRPEVSIEEGIARCFR